MSIFKCLLFTALALGMLLTQQHVLVGAGTDVHCPHKEACLGSAGVEKVAANSTSTDHTHTHSCSSFAQYEGLIPAMLTLSPQHQLSSIQFDTAPTIKGIDQPFLINRPPVSNS